jgi:uncharacterized membrane protein
MSGFGGRPTVPNVTAEPRGMRGENEGEGMKTHEGKMGRRSPKRARLVAAATALVSAVALAAPSMAGAALYSFRTTTTTTTTTSSTTTSPISLSISQNTSMIVTVAPTTDTSLSGTVSWSDVSWSDSSLVS